MSLDYTYGINTGNRFSDLLDHDEDPDDFIAQQTQLEEKPKKTSKDVKSATTTTAATKKKTTTTTAATSATNVGSSTTKTNKENITGKSQSADVRRQQQSNVLGDNNNQQTRPDSGRGGGRGSARRGGNAGQDRPPYEGGSRGNTQRYQKFEGQQTSTEGSGFEQGGDGWRTEGANDNQPFGEFRGRGRGRGNYEGGRGRGNYEGGRGRGNYEGGRGRGNYEGGRGRGNYEGGRGRGNYEGGRGRGNYEGGRGRGNYEGGRGRGRGGRGNFNNQNTDEDFQQQPPTQESNTWETSADANFDSNALASTRPAGQDFDADAAPQERPFEPGNRRGGRGQFRSRTFHNNRNYGSDRPNQYEREGDQDDPRRNRRQHDRQPRNFVSGVKPIEKKDGEGAHNWGSLTENPEDNPVVEETADATDQAAPSAKGWAEQVEEAEKQMTLDEYKKQVAAKKRAQQEKVPQFKTRIAGEGEDPKAWKPVMQEYRKKNDNGESEGDEEEEGDQSEGNESEGETEEQISGKKKLITIPIRFNSTEMPRGGPAGPRGGPRRGGGGGGGGRYRDRPDRDENPRSKSPSQQQANYYQQTGEYHNDEPQSRPYRGGSGRGSGRGEYRRSYGNSARGSRGSYNRATADPNTPDFDNTIDFPTLPK